MTVAIMFAILVAVCAFGVQGVNDQPASRGSIS